MTDHRYFASGRSDGGAGGPDEHADRRSPRTLAESLPPRLSHESASRSHALSGDKKSSFNLDFPDGVVRTY